MYLFLVVTRAVVTPSAKIPLVLLPAADCPEDAALAVPTPQAVDAQVA